MLSFVTPNEKRCYHLLKICTEIRVEIKIHIKNGQRVSLRDHLGDMGNKGCSTGTHIHYEVTSKKKL